MSVSVRLKQLNPIQMFAEMEALLTGAKAGVDPMVLREIWTTGGGNSIQLEGVSSLNRHPQVTDGGLSLYAVPCRTWQLAATPRQFHGI